MLTDLQKIILKTLAANYPGITDGGEVAVDVREYGFGRFNNYEVVREVRYFAEHGVLTIEQDGKNISDMDVKLTAKGRDLFEGGGISSIFNTVTVRFDADNIRSLIEDGVLKLNIPSDKKHGIIEKIRSLPEKALESLAIDLIKNTLKDPVATFALLRTSLATMGISF